MAFQVGSACYGTAVEAASAQASAMVGTFIGTSSVSVADLSATSITYLLTPSGGGAPVVHVAPFTAQPCLLLGVAEGIEMGWMVGAAWIAAYCILFLAKALRGETGESYGNS